MKFKLEKKTNIDKVLLDLNPKFFPLLVFILTFVLYLLNLSALGALGNGMNTICRGDLKDQIIPFIFSFLDVIKGKNSFWYSWNMSIGSGAVGSYAYYSLSPFNIVYLIFGKGHIEAATVLVISLKASFAATTFQIFIRNFIKYRYYETVLISIMYAFCGYFVCYYQMIIFMDGVLIFPVIALGILKLFKEDKPGLLIFGYTYIFIVQFYMGYIVGISSFAIFVVYYLYSYSRNPYKIKTPIKYALSVIISLGLSAFIWLPAVKQILEMGNFTDIYKDTFSNNIILIINNMFLGQNQDIDGYVPYVYCGTISVISVPMLFVNKKISIKKKIFLAALIIILLGCFLSDKLDLMMHGFDQPNKLGYRYSFVFSFVILVLLSIEYPFLKKELSIKYIVAVFIFYCILFIISRRLFIMRIGEKYNASNFYVAILEVIFIFLLYFSMLSYRMKNNDWLTPRVIMTFVIIAEISTNFFICLRDNIGLTEEIANYYNEIHDNTFDIIEQTEKDDGFYRYIFEDKYITNSAMLHERSSLAFFSSILNSKMVNCLIRLGFSYTANCIDGNGWTPVTSSLLGINAVVDGSDIRDKEGNYVTVMQEGHDYHQNMAYNSRIMPIGFASDKGIVDYSSSDSPFDNQEQILSLILGEDVNCYEYTEFEMIPKNARIEKRSNGIRIWNLGYPTEDAFVVYATTEDKVKAIYANLYNTVTVDVETKGIPLEPCFGRFMSETHSITLYPNQIFYIDVNKDGYGNFTMTIPKDLEFVDYKKGYFTYYDKKIFDKAYRRIIENALQDIHVEDGMVTGNISVDSDCILFTSIPNEDGWKAYVDGNETIITPILEGAFLGIDLSKGEHSIILKYTPPLRNIGIIITIFSGVFIILFSFVSKKAIRRKNGE